MADVFSKRKRSEVMSRIRGRGNKDTELALAAVLRAQRIVGWRRQMRVAVEDRRSSVEGRAHSGSRPSTFVPRLTVRPDFVFPKQRVVIFVDGCFWHGCPKHCNPMKWLKKSSMPASNPPSPKGRLRRTGRSFWRKKLAGNKARDQIVTRTLRRAGWRVLRVWEHELAKKNEARLVRRLSAFISG